MRKWAGGSYHVGVGGGIRVLVIFEEQKIADSRFIELVGNFGVTAHAFQRIAQDNSFGRQRVKQELDAKMIDCRQKPPARLVP